MAAHIRIPTTPEFPPAGDLRRLMAENPLPQLSSAAVEAATSSVDALGPEQIAKSAVEKLNAALGPGDAAALTSLLFAEQAYFRDQVVLTGDGRTFSSPIKASTALVETTKLRQLSSAGLEVVGATFIQATPTLVFLDATIGFATESPKAKGKGRVVLLPTEDDWKIWIVSTYLDQFDGFDEDEERLKDPVDVASLGDGPIETDVLIIGGGNGGVTLGARLKALSVPYLIIEKNARPGDNWSRRYECLQFHVPTSFCELPYIKYDKELQTPHLLTRDDLAAQVRRFVETFPLHILYRTTIQSTRLDTQMGKWTIELVSEGEDAKKRTLTVITKHLVQATGLGSQVPYKPNLPAKTTSSSSYTGIDVHSTEYTNARALSEKGARSVAVIGSANTAFDIMADCVAAGLKTTMVARSPTYLVPVEYVCDQRGLGVYDVVPSVEVGDHLLLTLPSFVDAQLSRGLFAMLAAADKEAQKRYQRLEAAGFPVIDSTNPDASLTHNLMEKAGGHYVDIAECSNLIADGKAAVRGNVEPIAYTEHGLQLSDNSTLDVDAIVWCTGFSDKDVRYVAASILGEKEGNEKEKETDAEHILSPTAIADLLDASWGYDGEGEVRGVWKRQSRLSNYWVMGGFTQQHRFFSRTLAQQIKASLEGILPSAYQGTV